VPAESEVPAAVIQPMLDRALAEAEESGIKGRELTPFLLRRMSERSGGATLRSNLALLEQNARVAAEIAKAVRCP
jgi:pseudouridine-5'-phosphate glycosidase